MLKIGHEVVRPGKNYGDNPVTIPVPEELKTVPGIPLNNREVDWYSREYPLESLTYSERALSDWSTAVVDEHTEMREILTEHYKVDRDIVMAGRETAGMEPTAEPTGEEVTDLIKDRARQLGYVEVGFTVYDPRYEYKHQRGFTELPTAICLAYEQDFEPTQTIPSVDAEIVHMSVYRTQAAAGLQLGIFIRSLGYRAPRHPLQRRHRPHDSPFRGRWLGSVGCLRLPAHSPCGQQEPVDDGHHRRQRHLRRAHRLRHTRFLPGVPGLR